MPSLLINNTKLKIIIAMPIIFFMLQIFFPLSEQRYDVHQYVLQFGFREVWLIHPPSRSDLQSYWTNSFLMHHAPIYYASVWDLNTTKRYNMSSISRKYTNEHKWLPQSDIVNTSINQSLLDIYGGWTSHLYCWNRIVAFAEMTQLDIPTLIMEDDVRIKNSFFQSLKEVIADAPSDWAILNLNPLYKACETNISGYCKCVSASLSSAYLIRNSSVASHLFSMNNNIEPPWKNVTQKELGWKPIIANNLYVYYPLLHTVVTSTRRHTRYSHSVAFTPS